MNSKQQEKAPSNNLKTRWDTSYERGENNILEPYEETVKFLSRFVLSRSMQNNSFTMKEQFCTSSIGETVVVDVGCGIGAQSEYLSQLGFKCFGYDLSSVAIKAASARTSSMSMAPIFDVCQAHDFSPPNNFHIAIACASLDSMPFEDASVYLQKLNAAAAPGALFFGTIIGALPDRQADEQIVNESYENGTIQSYFDSDKINKLLGYGNVTIQRLDKMSVVNLVPGLTDRTPDRFSVVGKFGV